MERNPRLSTWTGVVLGVVAALALNVALAHASDDAVVTEEFHHSYRLSANGKVELQNINGAVHISAWDRNEVKVDAIKRASDQDELKREEIMVDAHPDSISIETKYNYRETGWHDPHHHPTEVEYTLSVPRGTRLDEIKLINGGLDVNGVTGEVRASCI